MIKSEILKEKIKYKGNLTNKNRNLKSNPELSKPKLIIVKQFKKNRGLDQSRLNLLNSKVNSINLSKVLNNISEIDAKLKHKKKRDGD